MIRDITTPHLSAQTTDTPVRGYIELSSGETGIVLDGGRVLVCKAPRLLSAHASARLLAEWEAHHAPERCGLAAIANAHGPSREATLARRREETQKARDRRVVATLVDVPDAEYPSFTDGSIGGRTDVERKARTEEIARTVPDV